MCVKCLVYDFVQFSVYRQCGLSYVIYSIYSLKRHQIIQGENTNQYVSYPKTDTCGKMSPARPTQY